MPQQPLPLLPELFFSKLAAKERHSFRALFHDTHHRAYTRPKEIGQFRIPDFDGVLAFGESIRQIYLQAFNAPRAWTFHEAADTARFSEIFARRGMAERFSAVPWASRL